MNPEVENMDPKLFLALRKATKKANPGTVKAAMLVLDTVGVTVTEIKKGWTYTLTTPEGDTATIERPERYRHLPTEWFLTPVASLPYLSKYNATEEEKAAHAAQHEAAKTIEDYIIAKACEILGVENKFADVDPNRPVRSRDYLTDLTIRTCPVCFRDIKASGHTHGMMADHGYTIQGRSYWMSDFGGGHRSGSCEGVNVLPWEKACDPAKEEIERLERLSESLMTCLTDLRDNKITEIQIEERDFNTRKMILITRIPADGYKWKQTLERRIWETEGELRRLWSGFCGSIPWYRMAVRTWAPVPDDVPAVGAPRHKRTPEDFVGKPAYEPKETNEE